MPSRWIGVDVGGTKTAVVMSSNPPAIELRRRFATIPSKGPGRALELIAGQIRSMLSEEGLSAAAIAGIGVSCGGPLDRDRGVIRSPPNLPTWVDVPIKDFLQNRFGARCEVENDANAGAVAEYRFGAGRGSDNMVFLTMGTGLGAGIILDGHLYRGASGLAGEVGHLRLTRTGPVGHGKAGSAEGWASGGGLARAAESAVAQARRRRTETTLAAVRARRALTARDVAAAARKRDPIAMQLVRRAGERLGELLAILVDLLNPEKIVIGGMAPRLGDALLGPAREAMLREALRPAAEGCEVVPAALGERIGDVAALCVAMGL